MDINLVGQQFVRLTVLKYVGKNQKGTALFECKCVCGNKTQAQGILLKNGHKKSCGCLKSELTIKRNKLRGLLNKRKCSVEYCSSKHYAKGYCERHYRRDKKHGDPINVPKGMGKKCTIDGCNGKHSAKGLCPRHYQKYYKYGDPNMKKAKGKNTCELEGCNNYQRKYGYCKKHYRVAMRREVITNYGGKCNCCGEDKFEFLCIDHIYNDATEDKKRGLKANSLLRYLIKKNFPKDRYQILCHNCNAAKQIYGLCPHRKTVFQTPNYKTESNK